MKNLKNAKTIAAELRKDNYDNAQELGELLHKFLRQSKQRRRIERFHNTIGKNYENESIFFMNLIADGFLKVAEGQKLDLGEKVKKKA